MTAHEQQYLAKPQLELDLPPVDPALLDEDELDVALLDDLARVYDEQPHLAVEAARQRALLNAERRKMAAEAARWRALHAACRATNSECDARKGLPDAPDLDTIMPK
jgi:hypothetical protein